MMFNVFEHRPASHIIHRTLFYSLENEWLEPKLYLGKGDLSPKPALLGSMFIFGGAPSLKLT